MASVEYGRFLALVRDLSPEDWRRKTDCTLWDVQAVVAHNLGNMEANASLLELMRQLRTASKRARASGRPKIDEMTGLQVEERATLSPSDLVSRVASLVPKALRGRRRPPAVVRRHVRIAAPPSFGSMRLGYLLDTIYTRDVWMHRIDVSRATNRDLVLDPDHDGRVVAAVVCDWAAQHGEPYDLTLEGPAGGRFRSGAGAEPLCLDSVEFCRIVSGRNRSEARGLLATEVLF
jgi:uncharacterized protein (TIGR03083 family)